MSTTNFFDQFFRRHLTPSMVNNMALGLALIIAATAVLAWHLKYSSKPALPKKLSRNSVKGSTTPAGALRETLAKKAIIHSGASLKFHAVAIQAKNDCCAAAKAISGTRFLANEAPAIPLSNCDAGSCHCNYVHFSDRRENEDDRRATFSIQTELYRQTAGRDRRDKRGRRKNDGDV